MPTLSIVIATYQSASTLPRALDSALVQTRPADEIIVCDDGSTDDTADVLARYGSQVVVVRQANGGVSSAFNAAAQTASGDWVILLAADDEWLPSRLADIEETILSAPGADIVSTNALVRRPGHPDALWRGGQWPEPEEQPAAIVRGSFIFGEAAVRRSALERVGWFRTDLAHQGEWEAWVRLILSGSRAALSPRAPSAIYHQGAPGQLSLDKTGTYRVMLQVLAEEAHRHGPVVDAAIAESRRKLLTKLHVSEGVAAARAGDRRGCLRAAAARGVPAGLRAKFGLAALLPVTAAQRLG